MRADLTLSNLLSAALPIHLQIDSAETVGLAVLAVGLVLAIVYEVAKDIRAARLKNGHLDDRSQNELNRDH